MYYLFWLGQVLVAACMGDLVAQAGIEPGTPALGARSLTHWTTREVPRTWSLNLKNYFRRLIYIFSLKAINRLDETLPHSYTHTHSAGSVSLENPDEGFSLLSLPSLTCLCQWPPGAVQGPKSSEEFLWEPLFVWLGWWWRTSTIHLTKRAGKACSEPTAFFSCDSSQLPSPVFLGGLRGLTWWEGRDQNSALVMAIPFRTRGT